MTRAIQKAAEKRQVESFFRSLFWGNDAGIVVDSRDPPEPDNIVQGVRLCEVAGEGVSALYVEVTGYHPPASDGDGFRRTENDSRWQLELLPAILTARKANPAMKSIAAQINFKDVRLPSKRHDQAIVADLIRAVGAAIPRILPGQSLEVSFQPRETVAKCPLYLGNMTLLAAEDFPVAAEHFSVIRLRSHPDWEWPPWSCPRMLAGWNSPTASEFTRILRDKEAKAQRYDTQGRPLWLLIVAEFDNDLESHIFPRERDDLDHLREQIAATVFDFAAGPFQQVWLFSEFTEGSVRLYPSTSAATQP
ncbi:MAG TPA: hypothetical protein VK395_13970 [Gemmataceae bacterium]|nr:hypothetical protein [Gemmataceae bacterium]